MVRQHLVIEPVEAGLCGLGEEGLLDGVVAVDAEVFRSAHRGQQRVAAVAGRTEPVKLQLTGPITLGDVVVNHDRASILADISAGMAAKPAACVIEDRRAAIAWAVAHAGPCDVVLIAGNGDSIFKRLMRLVGRSDLATDPSLADNAGRVARAAELDEVIDAVVGGAKDRKLAGGLAKLVWDRVELAEDALAAGRADATVFGSAFLANPDLPERLRLGAALNAPDRATFYGGGAAGYTDYPTLATAAS